MLNIDSNYRILLMVINIFRVLDLGMHIDGRNDGTPNV